MRDWRPLCHQAAALPSGNDATARQFFEANFVPVLIASKGASKGLFTGYWEVELDGSRTQGGPYQVPVYGQPKDLVAGHPYLDRAAIEDGALAGKGLEILWLKSPDDLFCAFRCRCRARAASACRTAAVSAWSMRPITASPLSTSIRCCSIRG